MDTATLVDAIGRNISINVETIPRNKNIILNESNSTPLHVRIKLHNKDDVPSRKFHISKPKATQYVEKPIKQCSSEQTILSFNLLVEPDAQKHLTKPRKRFFNRLLPNACMGIQISDDEDPYLPSATRKKFSSTSQNSGSVDFKDPNRRDKKRKFKPGGCLDPTFSDEKISYKPTIKIPVEKNDDINYLAQKQKSLLVSANKKDNKSVHSLYQAVEGKSSRLMTYPHNGKEIVQEKRLASENTRTSSTFNQSAQYYFGQTKTKISTDNAKKISDSQMLSRELLRGSEIVEAVLANTTNFQSAVPQQKENIEVNSRQTTETRNSIENRKTKTKPKKKKRYKPGGCLDPHVSDEDHYAYMPSKKKIAKEGDGITLINDIYKDEIRLKEHEPMKVLSQSKISSIIEANTVREEAFGEMEPNVNAVENKRGDSPKRNKALIAAGGVATGVAVGTIVGLLNKNSSEKIKENKYEQDDLQDPITVDDQNKTKLDEEDHTTPESKLKNTALHDFEPEQSRPQERQSLRDRITRLSKNRLSAELKKGDIKSNISISKSQDDKKSSKGSFDIQLLKDDPSEKFIRRTSRDSSRKSSPERNKSPERKEIQRSGIDLSKELLCDETAQSSKDFRDNIPKSNTSQISATQNTEKSQKTSQKQLSTELLDRGAENKLIKNMPISSSDTYYSNAKTDNQVTQKQKTSPNRASIDRYKNAADTKLIKISPEQKKSKDSYNSFESANKSRQSSPFRLSESKFSEKQLRKISPDGKNSKSSTKESIDMHKNQSQKTSPKRLSHEFEAKTADSQISKRISDQKRMRDSNASKERMKLYKDQSQKSSPKKLSTELIEKPKVNKSNKNSPERRYSNDFTGIQLLKSNLESDAESTNVQSRRSSRQFSSDQLKKTDDTFERLSTKVSPEQQISQHIHMSKFNDYIEDNNVSKGATLQQTNDKVEMHIEPSRKNPDRKPTDNLNETFENTQSSMSIDRSTHRITKSGHDLSNKIPKEDFSREDNSQSLQSTQKNMSSDLLRKSADKTEYSRHSSSSMKTSLYKTPLTISESINDDNDLKDTTQAFKEKSESQDYTLINKSLDNQNVNDTGNEIIIATDRKTKIFEEGDISDETHGRKKYDKVKQWADDQTTSDYERNQTIDQNNFYDQQLSTLYEDTESKLSQGASFNEQATFQKNGEIVNTSNKPSITAAQNAHSINKDVSKPGFQKTISDHMDVTEGQSSRTILLDSPNVAPSNVFDDEGHVLNLKDSVSNIFHPINFRSKLDNRPLYEYEDDEKYQPLTESKQKDWSLDPKNTDKSSRLSGNKSKRSVQITTSSPSVTSTDVMLENGPLVIDMAFQTYKNDANEMVIKSLDSNIRSNESARSSQESHTVKQRFQKYSDKVKIPISSSSILSIQIQKRQMFGSDKESMKIARPEIIVSPNRSNSLSNLRHDAEDFQKTNDKYTENKFMDLLGTIYEHELLPLQQIMKHLKIEIDRLTHEQIQLNKKLQRSNKPDRLIPVNTTCRCHYK